MKSVWLQVALLEYTGGCGCCVGDEEEEGAEDEDGEGAELEEVANHYSSITAFCLEM